ncbi:MAG TPA: hypothetical protein VFH76_03870 [Kribbella sp.]|nr:hypothetical protein [Kribbella sp.]
MTSVDRPAGNLYRVTAAVVALSVPLAVASYVLQLTTGLGRCRPYPDCQVLIAPDPYTGFILSTTAGAELALIGGYLLFATARGRLAQNAAVHTLPTVIGVVVLAVVGLGGWLDAPTHRSAAPAAIGYRILLCLWLLAPLVLYRVHRGDRGAAIPVALALLPTVFVSMFAFPKVPLAALPPVMLAAAVVTIVIVRRRSTSA